MTHYDLFNGDADGICSLTQYRLANPQTSTRITGVKRDINLLKQVQAQPGDVITVLDVSLDKNREGLVRVLEQGAEVLYIDHHFAGEIPQHDRLTALINPAANVCTSILVSKHIDHQFRLWGVTGAFGDNFDDSARSLAGPDVTAQTLTSLKNLGMYINYNGYGATLSDLHFTPSDLYDRVSRHRSPLEFIEEDPETFGELEAGYHQDMATAASMRPVGDVGDTAVYVLPNENWARRVSGVYSNDLATASPDRAHAVLTHKADGTFLVSVRAPMNNKTGADEFCGSFPTGGGRKAAAGINALPGDELDSFIEKFAAFYKR